MATLNEIDTFGRVAGEFYPDEKIKPLHPLDSGVSRVWLCQSQNGDQVVLKQFPFWFDDKDVRFIHRFNLFLAKGDVDTLQLIPNISEQTFSVYRNSLFALYRFEEGDEFLRTVDNIRLAGCLLGQFHKRSANYRPKNVREWWTMKTHPAVKNLDSLNESGLSSKGINACRQAWEKIRSIAEILSGKPINHLVIHGDFRSENLKFQKHKAVALDLDNCRQEIAEMDFARSLRSICGLPSAPGWHNYTREFLKAYSVSSGVRPDSTAILTCLLAQPLKEALWLAGSYVRSKSQTLIKDFYTETNYLTVLISAFPEIERSLYEV